MFRGTLHPAILVDWNSRTHLDNGTIIRIGKYIIKGRRVDVKSRFYKTDISEVFSI